MAHRPSRLILGLMSGTSLDGLDLALCQISGAGAHTQVRVLHFETRPYDEHFKTEIRRVFAKKEIDFQHLALLNPLIAARHAELINNSLNDWGIAASDVDLIASHGQTVFHAPRILHGLPDYPNATLQIGDGDHLARRTGINTVSDFRQKHVAAGGEGAPLALYGDYFLYAAPGEDRFLLNIGGIANFSFLPGNADTALVFATDTGPGNTLIDAYARQLFGVPYDRDALLARAGRIDAALLNLLKTEPYFEKPFPKTTGPEQFSIAWVESALHQYPKGRPNPYDIMATLTRLTAETIAEAILYVQGTTSNKALYLSGGGAHNPLIVKHLNDLLPGIPIQPMHTLGIDGDAKEAVLFAVLANETVAGTYEPGARLGGLPLFGMGKISFPD